MTQLVPVLPTDTIDLSLPQSTFRTLTRQSGKRRGPTVAVLRFVEAARIESRFGRKGLDQVREQVAWLLRTELSDKEGLSTDENGGLVLTLRGAVEWQTADRLSAIAQRLARLPVRIGADQLTITPVIGWASSDDRPAPPDLVTLIHRATDAAEQATEHVDLIPRKWVPPRTAPSRRKRGDASLGRAIAQNVFTLVVGLAVPFLLLVLADRAGFDISTPLYLAVVGALVLTAVAVWTECFYALEPERPPREAAGPEPAASAIIPAYLPNEAATILDTLAAFLATDYGGPLQVILAYNTPHALPVEEELRALAAREPRLVVHRVPYSTSKAQNVNAALELVTGEFVGIFDADHQPAPDAFSRAWRWLSHGADVVQGHCVIRNGGSSWVSRMVAVEFEAIYAVNHPGRARLHGFGLFGGSNGFWRTQALHETRLQGRMLTEDIDATVRALLAGRTVVSDPALLSRELAPANLRALWRQRIRWAQGWFQVSRRHLAATLQSKELSVRNKLGLSFLIGWREIYPWISLQMITVIGFLAWRDGGFSDVDFLVPTFVLATLYTMLSGPAQALFAWRLAAPEIRRHRAWFLIYLVLNAVFYTEFKNHIGRVAQLKELTGERRWAITPRQVEAPVGRTA